MPTPNFGDRRAFSPRFCNHPTFEIESVIPPASPYQYLSVRYFLVDTIPFNLVTSERPDKTETFQPSQVSLSENRNSSARVL